MASLGRWNAVDPLAELQNSYSVYHYTYNNPLAFNDPTGMVGESINSSGKETERSISRDANGTPTGVRIGYAKDSGTNSGYSTTTARTGSSGNSEQNDCCAGALTLASRGLLTGISADIAFLEPTDLSIPKWVGYAVSGSLAITYLYLSGEYSLDASILYSKGGKQNIWPGEYEFPNLQNIDWSKSDSQLANEASQKAGDKKTGPASANNKAKKWFKRKRPKK